MAYNDTVPSHVDVRSHTGGVDDRVLPNNDIVSYLQGVESTSLEGSEKGHIHTRKVCIEISLPMRQLLEWWSNDCSLSDHALPTNIDVCQVSADDTLRLDYGLSAAE